MKKIDVKRIDGKKIYAKKMKEKISWKKKRIRGKKFKEDASEGSDVKLKVQDRRDKS